MLIQIISCLFEWNLTGRFLSRDHISCFWSNIVQAYNCRTKCWPSTFLSIDCITNSNFQLICCPIIGWKTCWMPKLFHTSVRLYPSAKEYKEEGQCAQKGGRMLVFVICGFIENFLTNSYFILHIHQVKGFEMRHYRYLHFNFSVRYS